jgi:hypothetical protein
MAKVKVPRFARKYLIVRYMDDIELVARWHPQVISEFARIFGDRKPPPEFLKLVIEEAQHLRNHEYPIHT